MPASWWYVLYVFDTNRSKSLLLADHLSLVLSWLEFGLGVLSLRITYVVSNEHRLRFWPFTLKALVMCSQSLSRGVITEKASECQED